MSPRATTWASLRFEFSPAIQAGACPRLFYSRRTGALPAAFRAPQRVLQNTGLPIHLTPHASAAGQSREAAHSANNQSYSLPNSGLLSRAPRSRLSIQARRLPFSTAVQGRLITYLQFTRNHFSTISG